MNGCRNWIRRLAAVLLATALLALGAAACGEGGEADTTTAVSQQRAESGGADATGRGSEQRSRPGEDASRRGDSGGAGSTSFAPKPHHDSGGGSKQFRAPGADNSVQEFGSEASASDFEKAAAAFHSFLDARAQGAWAAACRYLASSVVESLEQLAARSQAGDATGCAALLAKLTTPAAEGLLRREAAGADVGALRVEGERAFLIYRDIRDDVLAMPMTNEAGHWKVAALAGVPLN